MSDSSPDLESVVENLADMPALPTVVARLSKLIADPDTTANDINDALSTDPGLVSKILKLVNSSYYGFARRITTVTNAVVILGFNQVKNLALSAFIYDKFAASKGTGFDINGVWKHSVGTAILGAGLARHRSTRLEEDAFICGLLHDLGKFMMAQYAAEHLALVLDQVARKDILFHEAEKICLGYDHAELGAVAMERWNLPVTLVDVVRNHHEPSLASDSSRLLCCITSVAEITARALLMGNGGDAKLPQIPPEAWDEIAMDWDEVETVARKAADEFSKSDIFFSHS